MTQVHFGSLRWNFLFFLVAAYTSLLPQASAFDAVPEYRSVWGDRPLSESLSRFDSEYTSDFLTYQLPISFTENWITKSKIYQFAAGSLSGKEFLVEHRLKIATTLTDKIDFQFTWFNESDWEEDQSDFFWELKYQLKPNLKPFAFGNLQLTKAHDDVGFGLEHMSASQHRTRLSLQFPDFQRSKRAQDGTKWEKAPIVYSLVGDKSKTHGFYQYYLRYEPRATLLDQDEQKFRDLEKGTFGAIGKLRAWSYRMHYDNKREAQYGEDGSGLPLDIHRQRRLIAGIEYQLAYQRFSLSPRLYLIKRWIRANSEVAKVSDYAPAFWIFLAEKEYGNWSSQHQVGFDTVYHVLTNNSRILPDQNDNAVESRLNYKYEINFSNDSHLGLLLSFDLDRPKEAWEGGAGTFQLKF